MKRSKFSLSHYKLLSMNMGNLVPIGLTEVLPGDSIQQSTSALVRASPLMAPVMHPVHARIHHWFVPTRIIWEDFEDFITGGPTGDDASVFPTISLTYTNPTTGTNLVGGLADYLGVPPSMAIEVNALPFRAYAMIFNEWYRDQDLVNEVGFSIESGNDTTTNVNLLNAAWEKDYFTSARPWEQKGTSVGIPIAGSASLSGNRLVVTTDEDIRTNGGTGSGTSWTDQPFRASGTSEPPVVRIGNTNLTNPNRNTRFGDPTGLKIADNLAVDLATATGISINDLREAMAIQRYQEARARYGSRYVEYLRYLGVRSSDARLQRPEYLGGGKQTIQFSEVLQTTPDIDDGSTENSGVGTLRGHGIAAMRSNRYRRFFEEHGYIVSLLSVRPKTIYTQALPRLWNRRHKEDFWQRELQHIGQQPILNKEVRADHTTPEGIFGFQDRYDEYRRSESMVAGEFRTSELDFWHFARTFVGASVPALNSDFVTSTPTTRPFAVPSEDVLYVMANHSIQARRMLAASGKSFIY